jgi:hypothetical protein
MKEYMLTDIHSGWMIAYGQASEEYLIMDGKAEDPLLNTFKDLDHALTFVTSHHGNVAFVISDNPYYSSEPPFINLNEACRGCDDPACPHCWQEASMARHMEADVRVYPTEYLVKLIHSGETVFVSQDEGSARDYVLDQQAAFRAGVANTYQVYAIVKSRLIDVFL